MNPFLSASLRDLLAMVQRGDLSNPELDALCAACEGEFCEVTDSGIAFQWYTEVEGIPATYFPGGWLAPTSYTSDGREAMRLQETYRVNLRWYEGTPGIGRAWVDGHKGSEFSPATVTPLRSITEAAVVCALTLMIEKESA